MIEILVKLFFIISNTLYYLLYISFSTGKLIILALTGILQCLRYLYSLTSTLLTILSEDFTIFAMDIEHGFLCEMKYIIDWTHKLIGAIIRVLNVFKQLFHTGTLLLEIPSIFYKGVSPVFVFIGKIFTVIKKIFVHVGYRINFILSLVPRALLNVVFTVINSVQFLFVRLIYAFTDVLNIINFIICKIILYVLDIPIGAVLVSLAVICILYVIFNALVHYDFLESKVLQLLGFCYRKLTLCFNKIKPVFKYILPKRRQTRNAVPTVSPDRTGKEYFCVICDERQKCILFLPCKHVCTCSECSDLNVLYSRKCPLCRTIIERKLKIFL